MWDIGLSPPVLGRAVATESTCVLAAVTKVHLAYIIGTRGQKLTVSGIQKCMPLIGTNLFLATNRESHPT